ncbi:MAG: DUF2339 domain-containing protein [Stappiaceae bacterium]
MEAIAIILILIIAFLFIGALLAFLSWGRIKNLQSRLDVLELELSGRSQQKTSQPDSRPAATETAGKKSGETAPEQKATGQPTKQLQKESVPAIAAASSQASTPPGTESVTSKVHKRPPNKSFEERLGAHWAVWIGGLALVLGGIFLVRYSIEAGLLGPVARVSLGAVLAILLFAGAEWLRRHGQTIEHAESTSTEKQAAISAPYIPGILTLAGTTTAFATVFSAHALYGLIGPAAAFALLGIVALGTLLAAVLHGPTVASFGLVASYIVPFLVNSDNPALLPLAFYGLFVTLAAYGVARLRLWRWLAIAGVTGSIAWGHLLAFLGGAPDAGILAFFDVASLAMTAYIFLFSLYRRDPLHAPVRADWLAIAALGLHGLLFFYLLQINDFGTFSVSLSLAVFVSFLYLAGGWPVVAPLAYVVTALASISFLSFDVRLSPHDLQEQTLATPRIAAALTNPSVDRFLSNGFVLALVIGIGGLFGAYRSAGRAALATASMLTPLLLLGIAYFRIAPFETDVFLGGTALVLALVNGLACAFLERRLPAEAPSRNPAVAAFAIGTIAALVTGLSILLNDGWLTIALALTCAGIIWVQHLRPIEALRWVALVTALVCLASIAHDPTIVGASSLGATPFFNWLLVGYGVPALSFGFCAWLMAYFSRDFPQQAFTALCIFMVLLTGIVLVHHAMNPNNFYASPDTLKERSLFTLIFLAGSFVLQRLDLRKSSPVFHNSATILGAIGFLMMAFVHLIELNPFNTGEPIGEGLIFNLNLSAYLLPAILAGAIAVQSWKTRPQPYVMIASAISLLFCFAYVTAQVRAYFHGTDLSSGLTTDAELYVYSAAWLVLGIALLGAGFFTQSRMLRLGSAAVVVAVVVKVFLYDMASLDGVLRALSFIGLGIVLIGIGIIYQRLLQTRAADGVPITKAEN